MNGGHGLIELESTYNAAMGSLSKYIKQSKDRLTRLVQEYATGKVKYPLQKEANLIQKYMRQETAAHNTKNQMKSSTGNEKIEKLERKPMRGQSNTDFERLSVDKEKSMAWLCTSHLMGETGSLITAAQDRALNTHYQQRNIMKQPNDSKCRMCYKTKHIKHCCGIHNTCTI